MTSGARATSASSRASSAGVVMRRRGKEGVPPFRSGQVSIQAAGSSPGGSPRLATQCCVCGREDPPLPVSPQPGLCRPVFRAPSDWWQISPQDSYLIFT